MDPFLFIALAISIWIIVITGSIFCYRQIQKWQDAKFKKRVDRYRRGA